MLLPRSWLPARAVTSSTKSRIPQLIPSSHALDALRTAALAPLSLTFVRHATHQSEGRANGSKDGAGRRLGAKKTGEEYVIPGNIIFRQRGSQWHPGENVGMGRDHTIYALETGFVKYYLDPLRHPKRRYIGVVFQRDDTLPYPVNAARKRRLNMVAVPMKTSTTATVMEAALGGDKAERGARKGTKEVPRFKRGYASREANWEIGRTAERMGITAKEFTPGNRFLAWRKSKIRIAKNIEKRALKRRKK